MNKLRLLLKYLDPYKWSAFKNIFYNILSALFALFSYTMVIPFLKIMFSRMETAPDPGEFRMSAEYLNAASKYFFSSMIDKYGETGALLIVCLVVVIASLFKNGFIFLANNSMAYIRSCTVRDLRKKMYDKVLRLSLSFFTDARKGDIMTRISNDVQELRFQLFLH
jgi:subfamily B ATP-binding cassette protein MsbA